MKIIQYFRFLAYRFFLYTALFSGGNSNPYIEMSRVRSNKLIADDQKREQEKAAKQAHTKKVMQPSKVTVTDPSAEGFKSFLNALAAPTDRQSMFLSLLSGVLNMGDTHKKRMRLLLTSTVTFVNGNFSTSEDVSSIDVNAEGRWIPVRQDQITLDQGNLLVREYSSLMDQHGWLCAHDAEKLYSDFITSALIPALSEAAKASKTGNPTAAMLRVSSVTFDPNNARSNPVIEVSVTRYGIGTPSTVSLLIRFQRSAVAMSH